MNRNPNKQELANSKYYYALNPTADQLNSVLTDLVNIAMDPENIDKAVIAVDNGHALPPIDEGEDGESILNFVAGEAGGSHQPVLIDENEIPVGDGNQWLKNSSLYYSSSQSNNTYINKIGTDNNVNSDKILILNDNFFDRNSSIVNQLTLGNGSKLFLGSNPNNNSSYTLYDGQDQITIDSKPEVTLKGAVKIDIDSGYSTFNGANTILMHGGVHLDLSNYYATTYYPYEEPSVMCSYPGVDAHDCSVIIHGNSRVLLDHSTNVKMNGDATVFVENASFILRGSAQNTRNKQSGIVSQCQFTVNNGNFIINGTAQEHPTVVLNPDSILFTTKASANAPEADLSNTVLSINGVKGAFAGNVSMNVATSDGGTFLFNSGASNGANIKFEVTSDSGSNINYKIGGVDGGTLNYIINANKYNQIDHIIQGKTGQNKKLRYILEFDDAFIQLLDNTHFEMQNSAKIFMRGGNASSTLESPQHLGINWNKKILATDPNTYGTDYGNSPIFQMLNAPSFTMRGVWDDQNNPNPHTQRMQNSSLIEMTDNAEFRMWGNTLLTIDEDNGITISDGTTTISFTVAELAAALAGGGQSLPSAESTQF